ncbi:hypothetical protein AUC45_05935 [Erythrobacter sp. YT30]|nr:hypothetical protein AUC45_05935 [Erythrobacter sp. YT30]
MGIQYILDQCPSLQSVWGFGSYFRGGLFNDIDILAVVDGDRAGLVKRIHQIRECFMGLDREFGLKFNLLILTIEEFSERPLRDMDQLVLLGRR